MASRWSRVGIIKGPDAMRPTIPRHRHTGTPTSATLTEEAAAEGATLRLLREVTAETEIKKIFSLMDEDDNGAVTWEEFGTGFDTEFFDWVRRQKISKGLWACFAFGAAAIPLSSR